MNKYLDLFVSSYYGYAKYFWNTVVHPISETGINYFYWLILISLAVWGFEILFPWRKNQSIIRKDFWLDGFYMFFNFFFFNLLLFTALSNVTIRMSSDFLGFFGYQGGHMVDLSGLSMGWQLLLFFIIADFIQWCIHNLLHRIPFLWKFHKVHHSVREMGFAAHLRYHFSETVVYNSLKYITLSMLFGFKLEYAFIVHGMSILIGHLNHANLGWNYGPLKYILNNPKMHIWHHAKLLPPDHPKGMNFGISLSLWDYIFGTNYQPHDGRDIELGFDDVESYPDSFIKQLLKPFKKYD
jgi:sterol desaturase/sphingolipid hydroxylase (fatty acid hydroxylase superfamily)